MKDYLEINKHSWNNRLESHLNSDFYQLEDFLKGANSLKEIELGLLGNIEGKSILHLQCHFGQDSISLSRLDAKVIGVDFSDKSIHKAKELAKECKVDTQFICSDVYDLKDFLDREFDIVFTSYGTISWLPDLSKWADIIQHFLKPKGKFIFVEFHPVIWMFDDELEKVQYHYFNKEAIIEMEEGTYADKSANIKQKYACFNHGLAEVFNSLKDSSLKVSSFEEYDYSPYSIFSGMQAIEKGKFQIKKFSNKFPLVYSLVAQKI
jgi:ubiquinone/menaquinone biosynthesis C-methylase UbiE